MPPFDPERAEEDFATVCGLQTGNAFEERSLAGPVRPDQTENFAGTNRKTHVFECMNPPIGLGQAMDANDGFSVIVGLLPHLQPVLAPIQQSGLIL